MIAGKDELIRYWSAIYKLAAPYLARRPLKWAWRGANGKPAFHHGDPPVLPSAVHLISWTRVNSTRVMRPWVDSLDGVHGLVNIGALELHEFGCGVGDLNHPDRLAFNLKAGDGFAWDRTLESALKLEHLLRRHALRSEPRVSGTGELHVIVPLEGQAWTWDRAKSFVSAIGQQLVDSDPVQHMTNSKEDRRGRLLIDCLRSSYGQTLIAAYSPALPSNIRELRSSLPVVCPVTWEQVERGISPTPHTVESMILEAQSAVSRPGDRSKRAAPRRPGAARPSRRKSRAN